MTVDGLRTWHENELHPTLSTDACLSDGCHAQQQCNGEGKNTEKPEEARRMWHASLILYIRLCPSAARKCDQLVRRFLAQHKESLQLSTQQLQQYVIDDYDQYDKEARVAHLK